MLHMSSYFIFTECNILVPEQGKEQKQRKMIFANNQKRLLNYFLNLFFSKKAAMRSPTEYPMSVIYMSDDHN